MPLDIHRNTHTCTHMQSWLYREPKKLLCFSLNPFSNVKPKSFIILLLVSCVMVQLNLHMTLLKNDNITYSLGWLLQKRVQLSPNLFWSTFPIVIEELLVVVVSGIQSCPSLWDPIEENAKVDSNVVLSRLLWWEDLSQKMWETKTQLDDKIQ